MRPPSNVWQFSRHSSSPAASLERHRTSTSGPNLLGRYALGILALALTLLLVTVVVIAGMFVVLNLLLTLGLLTPGVGEIP